MCLITFFNANVVNLYEAYERCLILRYLMDYWSFSIMSTYLPFFSVRDFHLCPNKHFITIIIKLKYRSCAIDFGTSYRTHLNFLQTGRNYNFG